MEQRRTVIVGIGGPSGSGKTSLARRVVDSFPRQQTVLLAHDAYYRDLSQLNSDAHGQVNFDEPSALESDLLVAHLEDLRDGRSVGKPIYDFVTHTRTGSATVSAAPIVIVEGILVLAVPTLQKRLDLAVYVDTDLDVCLARRVERDLERGRSPESVRAQYEATVLPMFHEHVLPSRRRADVVVSGETDQDISLAAVMTALRRILWSRTGDRWESRTVDGDAQ